VRNVMSDLEEAGLLKQPHTSAGRVPTDQGLRFFVDSLLKVRSLSSKEKDELTQRYQLGSADLDTALRDATKVLSELSAHTVVLVTPRPEADVLDHVELVRLRDHQLLVVLVTKSGQVANKIIASATTLQLDELERMNNYLNAILGGLTLDGVVAKVHEELRSERVRYQEMERRALELSAQALPGAGGEPELIIEGQSRLIDSVATSGDPAALEKMRALFRALEEKRHLAELLDEAVRAPGIRVFIGAESHIEELSDFTVVATSYGPIEGENGRALGTLGVIGPTRMNYNRVINLVDFTAQIVSSVIGKR
jgi:heat-inducible transcriptional repressor